MSTDVVRLLPTEEAEALLALTRDLATKELAPQVAEAEEWGEFPEAAYRLLGKSGLLSLPFAEEHGGGGQPYEVYLQVVEELAAAWPSVAVGTSVHTLTAQVVNANASEEQRAEWLPRMLGGDWLGAYCLSEPQAGSDVSGIRTRAVREGDEYVVRGTKQWISNGSCADYYILFARTGDDPRRGLSAFIVTDGTDGMTFGAPEKKMGLACDVTTQVILDGARVPAGQRIGEEGDGMRVALSALDAGRLGIAAVATGIAQAALAHAVAYAREREQFGRPIGEFQGLQFLLAEMGAEVARTPVGLQVEGTGAIRPRGGSRPLPTAPSGSSSAPRTGGVPTLTEAARKVRAEGNRCSTIPSARYVHWIGCPDRPRSSSPARASTISRTSRWRCPATPWS